MAQETKKRVKAVAQQPMTLLSAIEQIVEQAENSALSEKFFSNVAQPIAHLGQWLGLNPQQAVMLALCANFFNEWNTLSEFAEYVDCKRLQMLHYAPALNELRKRHLIKIATRHNSEQYRITVNALRAIQNNEPPQSVKLQGLTITEFFARLCELTKQRVDDLEYEIFADEIFELLHNNPSLPFVEQLNGMNLTKDETVLFLWGCDMLVSSDDAVISAIDFDQLYGPERMLRNRQIAALRDGKSNLISKKLLQPRNENGQGSADVYELTSYVRTELLKELGVAPKKELEHDKNLIAHDSIVMKELFYNPREEQSLTQLSALLAPEQFDKICTRLAEKGLRQGFACLFYGAPGTGKTETVLQLARQTGRDLMQVNVSEIKSMWVGESEKNIKALFDRYRSAVKRSERAPILFFNEADAIISKRSENVARAVDKMENSIQNIILQEIENLEGILIATTNLTKNMDSAFERRFLYKIEFAKPSLQAKLAIWQSMLPSLSADDAEILAATYDFSGGQIENVARKHSVDEILTGHSADINRLIEFCEEELLEKRQIRRRIGF